MKPITKKLLLWLSAVAAWAITFVYAFDPLNPEQHRLCSGLPQHASWDISGGNKSVVWSYFGDLLNVVVPEWVQIWGALTPRTMEWKTLCTFTCDYWYKLDSSNQTCVEDPDTDPCPPRYVLNRDTNKCEKDIEYSITNNIKNDVVFYKNELSTKTIFDWELKAKDNITIDSWFIKTVYEHNFPENNNLEFTMYINWKAVSSLINLRDEANLDLSKSIQLATWDIIDIKIDISWTPTDSFYFDFYWYEIWFNGDNITLPFEYTVQLPRILINEVVLQNNLSESKVFKRQEYTAKTVFDWTYSTARSSKVNWWMIVKSEETEDEFLSGEVAFYLYINWQLVDTIKSRDAVWYSNSFTWINLTAWETINVKVDAEVYWPRAHTWTFNYELWLFDLTSDWEVQRTTDLVPIVIENQWFFKMNISSNITGSEVELVGSKNTLWRFVLTPETGDASETFIDTFLITIDSWVNVNLNDLIITIDDEEIECEDNWTTLHWNLSIKCDNLNYGYVDWWTEVRVQLKNPELWVYRTTISWINHFWDSYPTRRLIVNPFIELKLDHNDGQKTYYNILGEGFYSGGLYSDHFSNVKLYSGNYFTLEEANNATPVIVVNDEIDIFNHHANIYFDNLAEEVNVNTFRYESNWKTFIINKDMYPNYFTHSLHDLKVHAISNSWDSVN